MINVRKVSLPPYAPSLVESIRSIGYTFESAIADLMDNSITAEATRVQIKFSPYGDPFIGLLDNGKGMGPDELTQAMRHGSRNPSDQRSPDDLGRFGLGLKTASLSQCRRLTVISLKENRFSARCWDLDVIAAEEEWMLVEFDQEEVIGLPLVRELISQGQGTLVIWQDLDRVRDGELSIERALGEKMDLTREHLSLVFHRYLGGEKGLKKLMIQINGHPIEPLDPFLSYHRATEALRDEYVAIEGETISIKPFILPHISKLTKDDLIRAGGADVLRRNQGFYIYRNKRLITWGTWFRLIRQEELTKLARVRVDIPNSLDYLWTIDVKKSTASPPEAVRQNLKRIVDRIADGSRRVYHFRGRRTQADNLVHSWDRIEGREGIWYRINRNHPMVKEMQSDLTKKQLKTVDLVLSTLERTFPVDVLYADMAADRKIATGDETNIAETLRDLAKQLLETAATIDGGVSQMLSLLHILDPFCMYPEVTDDIIREFEHAK